MSDFRIFILNVFVCTLQVSPGIALHSLKKSFLYVHYFKRMLIESDAVSCVRCVLECGDDDNK